MTVLTAETATGLSAARPEPGQVFTSDAPQGEGLYLLLENGRADLVRWRCAMPQSVWAALETTLASLDVCRCRSTLGVSRFACDRLPEEPMCGDCVSAHVNACRLCD